MRAILGAGLVLVLACGAVAEDKKEEKIDGKKLIGKWESSDEKAPAKITAEYTADGKLTGTLKIADMELAVTGTYKLDGNKLTQTTKIMDKEQTRVITITKLTDTEMVGEWDGGKQAFKRVKE